MARKRKEKLNLWYGYKDSEKNFQVKRYFNKSDIEEAEKSSFVKSVTGPFPAKDREHALLIIKSKLSVFSYFKRLRSSFSGFSGFDIPVIQLNIIKKLYKKYNLDIVCTCIACPEQYDVFKNGEQVGYLRLRHGEFRVDYPNCGGETIFYANPQGDGIFEKNERFNYLLLSLRAINQKIK